MGKFSFDTFVHRRSYVNIPPAYVSPALFAFAKA
jgi:hypothetical protein